MPHPSPPFPSPADHALFLDFDGTLVAFAEDPDAVAVPPALIDSLRRLTARFAGALALVSGRRIAALDRLFAPLVLPAAGVHGLEFRLAGQIECDAAEAERLAPARIAVRSMLSTDSPIRVEDKGGAIVLHFRGAPQAAGRAQAIAEAAAATDDGLVAVAGHAIAEIRPRAITKAGAIARFLTHPPFAGRHPVFVGDDTTDEDGFRAAIAADGYAIKVGPGKTAAPYRLADIDAVHDWLRQGDGTIPI